MALYTKISKGPSIIQWPAFFNPRASDLILKLMETDPSKRYGNMRNGAGDVFAHPWFKEVVWQNLLTKNISPPYIPRTISDGDASAYVVSTLVNLPPFSSANLILAQFRTLPGGRSFNQVRTAWAGPLRSPFRRVGLHGGRVRSRAYRPPLSTFLICPPVDHPISIILPSVVKPISKCTPRRRVCQRILMYPVPYTCPHDGPLPLFPPFLLPIGLWHADSSSLRCIYIPPPLVIPRGLVSHLLFVLFPGYGYVLRMKFWSFV